MQIKRLLLPLLLVEMTVLAQNPIIQTKYTADPAPVVVGDTVYLFTSHDNGVRDGFDMTEWLLYTTTDMVNWTDHGAVASLKSFAKWASSADNGAWAVQALCRDGQWYMYCPIQLRGIGVLTAPTPYGPWTDPRKKAIINYDIRDIDPTVFVDDDGQAYIYWGNNGLWYNKLSESMTSFSATRHEIELTTEAFGGYKETFTNGEGKEETRIVGDDCYEEGPWFYKRNGKYYLVYAAGGVPEHLSYSISDSPTGPWLYKGKIMDIPTGSFTTHPGVIDYKGHSYIFYHSGQLTGGNGFKRSVCVDEFQYNGDGTIPFTKMTKSGVEPVGTLNPFVRIEAETMALSKGVATVKEETGLPLPSNSVYVNKIDDGDYVKVRSVDFGDNGASSVSVCIRSVENAGRIEVCIDRSSNIVATIEVSGVNDWTELTAELDDAVTGIHDIYFYFRATDSTKKSALFDFDYWQFSDGSGESAFREVEYEQSAKGMRYNLQGQKVSDSYRGIYIYNGRKHI